MDGARPLWYFSTVLAGSRAPQRVEFHRTKYGRELLLDAAFVREMPTFLCGERAHTLGFHDILLVTRGRGSLELDGELHAVVPGTVFFSRPGEVRRWRVRGLDGACLFFTEDFVTEVFRDGRFLEQLAYFAPARPSARLALAPSQRRQFLERFVAMRGEIAALADDTPHALRAVLYETLVRLNRWYAARHGGTPRVLAGSLVERFRERVERDFATQHRLGHYARELGVTPGHLNACCRRELRQTAGAIVRHRIALEARRLLRYSDLNAAQVADRLGFDDASYFTRFFRRETGRTPTRFRTAPRD